MTIIKTIFLDVDGVINSDQYFAKRAPNDKDNDIDMSKVKMLANIVSATGAVIVLSSSWKVFFNKKNSLNDYLNNCLNKYDMTIIDRTPNINMSERGREIREWVNTHEDIESWIVLDDEIFFDYKEFGIMDHLVKTNFYQEGLTQKHVDLAINILNK